jgi:hypothetical protein
MFKPNYASEARAREYPRTSALGQTQKSGRATIGLVLNNGHHQTGTAGPFRASKRHHSITWSALLFSIAGISRPSAFAVLRLTVSSYLVGW